MEILLFARGGNPVRELFAINNLCTLAQLDEHQSTFDCFAKAIVYATQPIRLTDELIAKLNLIEGLADRPHSPQLIERGHPIATVRAGLKLEHARQIEVKNRARLLDELRRRAEGVRGCTSS